MLFWVYAILSEFLDELVDSVLLAFGYRLFLFDRLFFLVFWIRFFLFLRFLFYLLLSLLRLLFSSLRFLGLS